MRYAMLAGLAGVLALGLAVSASGQNLPWKADGDNKAPAGAPAAGAPAAPGAPAAEGVTPAGGADPAKLEKAAAPVKDILAQVAKVQKLLDDEQAKPDTKRDAKRIQNFKESIARLYLSAAQKAKAQAQSAIFTKAEDKDKQAFLDQYEKPNRDKAIALLLELANEALGKKDYRNAEGLARQILMLDPKNAEAEALIKRIAEEKAAALKAGTKSSGSGDSLKDKNLNPNLKDWSRTNRDPKTDYGKTGRTW